MNRIGGILSHILLKDFVLFCCFPIFLSIKIGIMNGSDYCNCTRSNTLSTVLVKSTINNFERISVEIYLLKTWIGKRIHLKKLAFNHLTKKTFNTVMAS